MIDVDDSRAWEPWTPRIGQRVRIVLSPECRKVRERRRNGEIVSYHFAAEDGRTGVVAAWPPEWGIPDDGHAVCVDFDEPIDIGGGSSAGGCSFAACELEPKGEIER